jgi:hypothetical protein
MKTYLYNEKYSIHRGHIVSRNTVYGRDWPSKKPRGYDKKWYIHCHTCNRDDYAPVYGCIRKCDNNVGTSGKTSLLKTMESENE